MTELDQYKACNAMLRAALVRIPEVEWLEDARSIVAEALARTPADSYAEFVRLLGELSDAKEFGYSWHSSAERFRDELTAAQADINSSLNALKSAIATSARLNNPDDYCEEWRNEIANMQRVVDEIEGKGN